MRQKGGGGLGKQGQGLLGKEKTDSEEIYHNSK